MGALCRGGATSACRSREGMTPTGQGTLQAGSQHPNWWSYEGPGNRAAISRSWTRPPPPTENICPPLCTTQSCRRKHLESPIIQAWQRGVAFTEPGMVFSGGGEQQLVTCQAAVARSAKAGSWPDTKGREADRVSCDYLDREQTIFWVTHNVEDND